MTKSEIVEKLNSLPISNSEKQKLIDWVKSLPNTGTKLKPIVLKKGDVFNHPIFSHPCVLAKKKTNGEWIALLMTTEKECPEIIEVCNSRLFSNSFFTKAIFSFTPVSGFIGNFENSKQIEKVYKELKRIL